MAAKANKKKKAASTANRKSGRPIAAFMAACDMSARDPNSGKITLYGLFDTIQTESFPSRFGPFTLYAKISGGTGQSTGTFVLLDPKGREVPQDGLPQFGINFSLTDGRFELVGVLPPLQFRTAGIHRLYLKIDGHLVDHPFEIAATKIRRPGN